jgi:hypothetical protein
MQRIVAPVSSLTCFSHLPSPHHGAIKKPPSPSSPSLSWARLSAWCVFDSHNPRRRLSPDGEWNGLVEVHRLALGSLVVGVAEHDLRSEARQQRRIRERPANYADADYRDVGRASRMTNGFVRQRQFTGADSATACGRHRNLRRFGCGWIDGLAHGEIVPRWSRLGAESRHRSTTATDGESVAKASRTRWSVQLLWPLVFTQIAEWVPERVASIPEAPG